MYAWILGHRLGLLVGGDEGAELVQRAVADMQEQGIRKRSAGVAVSLPGTWGESD